MPLVSFARFIFVPTASAAPHRNESALAVQPPQADQPEGDAQEHAQSGGAAAAAPGGPAAALSTSTAVMVGTAIVVALTLIAGVAMALAPASRRTWPAVAMPLAQGSGGAGGGSVPRGSASTQRLVGKKETNRDVSLPVFFPGRPAPSSGNQLTLREALDGRGELPFLVILVAAAVGTTLLLLNVILICCFVHKRRLKERKQAEAEAAARRAHSTEGRGNTATTSISVVEATNSIGIPVDID